MFLSDSFFIFPFHLSYPVHLIGISKFVADDDLFSYAFLFLSDFARKTEFTSSFMSISRMLCLS